MTALREKLGKRKIVVAPGVFDGLSARLADTAGFEALYLSGASLAYTRFGRPDVGLVSMNEVADAIGAIREVVDLPLIVDADTGFGNALNVKRTVSVFERRGAAAIQLEDQTTPKRCGHLDGKALISPGEMVGKVRAACDARHDTDTLIVARTDAIAVEGLDGALDRAERYLEAGADILFVEAPQTRPQLEQIAGKFAGRIPLMANMVEGGKTPLADRDDLAGLGFRLVIFPGGLVRALARTAQDYFTSLHEHGSNLPFADRMVDFQGLNALLGTADLMADGARYEEEEGENG